MEAILSVLYLAYFPSLYIYHFYILSLYYSQNTQPDQDPLSLPARGSCFSIQQMPDYSKEQLSYLSIFFFYGMKFVFTISKV